MVIFILTAMRTTYFEAFLVVWLRSLFFRDVPYDWVIGSH